MRRTEKNIYLLGAIPEALVLGPFIVHCTSYSLRQARSSEARCGNQNMGAYVSPQSVFITVLTRCH
jgi:hypothetical protein